MNEKNKEQGFLLKDFHTNVRWFSKGMYMLRFLFFLLAYMTSVSVNAFTVTINTTGHGIVKTDYIEAAEGQMITLQIEPEIGHFLEKISATATVSPKPTFPNEEAPKIIQGYNYTYNQLVNYYKNTWWLFFGKEKSGPNNHYYGIRKGDALTVNHGSKEFIYNTIWQCVHKGTSPDIFIPANSTIENIEFTRIDEYTYTFIMLDGDVMIDAVFKEDPNIVKSIELNTSEIVINSGEVTTLTYVLQPDNVQQREVIWSSSDITIAEVNEQGVIIAQKAGTCIITATSVSNPTAIATCKITVVQPVTGVEFNQTELFMTQIGEQQQLVVSFLPYDASIKNVKWTSSNPAVCTVSENGTVVATGYGTATIVVTTEDGGCSAACVVNVSQPITVMATNCTKVYGDPNPGFDYVTAGDGLNGVPQITCDATEKSPVGTYPIVITQGSVTNRNVTYVNSTLTVTKAPLTVIAQNSTRSYGEENPVFELKYAGFVNSEDENVLVSLPKATTEATASSDAGEYSISVNGGVADNYEFNYVAGKLIVEKAYQTLTWEQDLSDVKQYEQVELTAVASSGLGVTYTVEGDPICSITEIGNKRFLDCKGVGETVIVAMQEGNKNYWNTTKIYKPITIKSATGIEVILSDADMNMYDVSGNRINKLRKGINIIKKTDGTVKKVIVK